MLWNNISRLLRQFFCNFLWNSFWMPLKNSFHKSLFLNNLFLNSFRLRNKLLLRNLRFGKSSLLKNDSLRNCTRRSNIQRFFVSNQNRMRMRHEVEDNVRNSTNHKESKWIIDIRFRDENMSKLCNLNTRWTRIPDWLYTSFRIKLQNRVFKISIVILEYEIDTTNSA